MTEPVCGLCWYRFSLPERPNRPTFVWWPARYFESAREACRQQRAHMSPRGVAQWTRVVVDETLGRIAPRPVVCLLGRSGVSVDEKLRSVQRWDESAEYVASENSAVEEDCSDKNGDCRPYTLASLALMITPEQRRGVFGDDEEAELLWKGYQEAMEAVVELVDQALNQESLVDSVGVGTETVVGQVPVDYAAPPPKSSMTSPPVLSTFIMSSPALTPPPLKHALKPHDSWETVWNKLQLSKWSTSLPPPHASAARTREPCWYVLPNRSCRPGTVEGTDYLSTLAALQSFCRTHYGWRGPEAVEASNSHRCHDSSSVSRSTHAMPPATPTGCQTKPRDPAKPRLGESDDDGTGDELTRMDALDWKTLWRKLVRDGWKVKAAHIVTDQWYYIRPGKSAKQGVLGRDYFKTPTDVIAYLTETQQLAPPRDTESVSRLTLEAESDDDTDECITAVTRTMPVLDVHDRRNSRTVPIVKPASHRVSTASTKISRKCKSHSGAKSTKARQRSTTHSQAKHLLQHTSSTGNTARKRPAPAEKLNKTKKLRRNAHWWKYEAIPGFRSQVWPALEKLRFVRTNDGYQLPTSVQWEGQPVTFTSATGLRKFLCFTGIPNYCPNEAAAAAYRKNPNDYVPTGVLTEAEATMLHRWVRFANVPIQGPDSARELLNVRSPRKENDLRMILVILRDLGFESDGINVYVPGANSQEARRGRRVRGVHYFAIDPDLYTSFREWVRNAWSLQLPEDASPKMTEAYLRLRVWAAASSRPLPVWQQLPPRTDYQALLTTAELEIEHSRVDTMVDDASEMDEDMSTANGSHAVVSQCDVSTEAPEPAKKVVVKKAKKDKRPWYLKDGLPRFVREILPTLRKLGFDNRSGKYVHPDISESFTTSEGLAQYLVRHGVPLLDDRRNELAVWDVELLERWVKFANVPVTENSCERVLSNVRILCKEDEILYRLFDLGFQKVDLKFFPPGADATGRNARKEGVHYFNGLQGIRGGYIRGATSLSMAHDEGPVISSRRNNKKGVSQEQLLEIRLWAALSDLPLPKFVKNVVDCKRAADDEDELDDVEISAHVKNLNTALDRVATDTTIPATDFSSSNHGTISSTAVTSMSVQIASDKTDTQQSVAETLPKADEVGPTRLPWESPSVMGQKQANEQSESTSGNLLTNESPAKESNQDNVASSLATTSFTTLSQMFSRNSVVKEVEDAAGSVTNDPSTQSNELIGNVYSESNNSPSSYNTAPEKQLFTPLRGKREQGDRAMDDTDQGRFLPLTQELSGYDSCSSDNEGHDSRQLDRNRHLNSKQDARRVTMLVESPDERMEDATIENHFDDLHRESTFTDMEYAFDSGPAGKLDRPEVEQLDEFLTQVEPDFDF